jgi:hypothetical protein
MLLWLCWPPPQVSTMQPAWVLWLLLLLLLLLLCKLL